MSPAEQRVAESAYVDEMIQLLRQRKKIRRPEAERLAARYGLVNQNQVKELTELAIVNLSREVAQSSEPLRKRFSRIVEIYSDQVNLSFRTSMSEMMQQYSTPAPISFLLGEYIRSNHRDALYFEPSAGNGLLTIALPPAQVIVNEVDDIRLRNLRTQGFCKVWDQDASKPFTQLRQKVDGVITNPPFGNIPKTLAGRFHIYRLEHLMSILALDTIRDSGRAALIICGHTHYDAKGRIQMGRNRFFLNYLYHHYIVDDVIGIDGKKLYSRQGTSVDVRLILISGRKPQPGGTAPLQQDGSDDVVSTWDALYDRIERAVTDLTIRAAARAKEIRHKLIHQPE